MRKLFRQQELMHFNSGHIFTNRAGKIHNATQIKHTKNITSLRKAKLYHPRFLVVWKWWAGDFSPLRVFFFKGTSVSISVVCTKTWRFHHEKQEAMLAGDSQFQEFFVKLQHLVLSLLANKIERWSFGPGRKVLPFFPHACALKTIKNMYTSWMSMVLSNRIITPI